MRRGKRPFAVFDIDGTLVRWQLYHAIADNLAKNGLISTKIYNSIKEARMVWKNRTYADSFKDYEKKLIAAYNILLKKLTVEQFNKATQEVFEEYKDQVYAFTRDLIKALKKDGYLLFAISGSQSEIVEKIAHYYNFDDFEGSVYEQKNGRFSGAVSLTVYKKNEIVKRLAAKHNATSTGSIAVGDSTSDIKMLEEVETAIAFNPEMKLFVHAKQKGWKIVIERKNVIYNLEPSKGKYVLAETIL